MYTFRFLIVFLSLFVTSFSILKSDDELLKKQDINRVMSQIFQQHGDKQGLSQEVLKQSFNVYINQFDPNHIYLLQDEVRPFLTINDQDAKELIQKYKDGDYSAFSNLNGTIQKAIERARGFRQELEKKPADFFTPKALASIKEGPDNSFAANIDELKQRMRRDMLLCIQNEIKRFGAGAITRNPAQTLALYEKMIRGQEAPYLGTDESGEALSAEERDNLFVLHVLKALSNGLDAHTSVLNSNEAYAMRVRLEKKYQGIGVALQKKGNDTLIVDLLDGSPAKKSGLIKINDRIVEVNGRKVTRESLDDILEWLRGPAGSTVSMVLKRGSSPQLVPVSLKREDIPVNEGRVESSYESFGNGIIGKVVLHSFYQGDKGISSENDLSEAVNQLKKQGNLRGLILDLRDNTGGFLNQAVKVAGLFISDGVVVISKYSSGEEQIYRDIANKQIYDGPLIVLTSKETASAAEIVAQALQDYGVALIVGDERTYGKGTIQSQTVTAEDGNSSFFKVTVGKYYTVSGRTPQLQGVKADIVVPGLLNNEKIGEEYLAYTEKPDLIPARYIDPLADIDPKKREWYMRYYTPHLQQKEDFWRSNLSILRKNSGHRLENNKDYKAMLQARNGSKDEDEDDVQITFTDHDLQMEEAVNISKDMIMLQSRARSQQ